MEKLSCDSNHDWSFLQVLIKCALVRRMKVWKHAACPVVATFFARDPVWWYITTQNDQFPREMVKHTKQHRSPCRITIFRVGPGTATLALVALVKCLLHQVWLYTDENISCASIQHSKYVFSKRNHDYALTDIHLRGSLLVPVCAH